MSKISIKIVEVHPSSQTVIVKFASEHSQKTLDEYDGLAFSVPNYNTLTPAEFIQVITPQISRLVAERDQSEVLVKSLDISSWENYTAQVDSIELAGPVTPEQIIPAQANPEVIL